MSLEAALEEERLEILKLLERPAGTKSPPPGGRSYGPGSPLGSRTTSPTRGKVTTSLVDIATPSSVFASKKSPNTSPTLKFSSPVIGGSSNGLYRTRNDGGAGAPRLLRDLEKQDGSGFNPEDTYQFSMNNSMIPSVPPAPKRVSIGGSKQPIRSMLGGAAGDDRFSPIGSRRSSSPATNAAFRHATRNGSPRRGTDSARSSAGRLASPAPDARAYSIGSVDDGALVDLQHAYRALNDEALASSGGVLQNLPQKKDVLTVNGEHIRAGSGESLTREGGVRLQKDYNFRPGGETAIVDSSDEDSTDDGETTSGEGKSEDEDGRRRGRSRGRTDVDLAQKVEGTLDANTTKKIGSLLNIGPNSSRKAAGSTKGPRKTMSLLAAAEEERKMVSSKNKVRSLLPSISVTQPGSAASSVPSSPITYRRPGVHPATNFDVASRTSTPMSSDTEMDLAELRRAQQMEMNLSQITSTPGTNRAVRTITRGDFDSMQREAEEGKRRQRTYLVATDMSAEAAHALEWTIGTVLRDGDTLLAIYAIDEDNVDANATPPSASTLSGVIDGSGDGRSTPTLSTYPSASSNSLSMLSNMTTAYSTPSSPLVSFSTPPSRTSTPPPGSRRGSGEKNRRGISREGGRNLIGERSKAELERIVAVENVTQLVAKLLKKTRLQVRCVVEVIHCKSPKHLLTEMIDYIEPTLVILGSRGRSALKGVLLGSFSNYLVTKSSVPVMVARKKLKQHTKQKKKGNVFAHGTNSSGPVNVRLANNLITGFSTRNLASAKVD